MISIFRTKQVIRGGLLLCFFVSVLAYATCIHASTALVKRSNCSVVLSGKVLPLQPYKYFRYERFRGAIKKIYLKHFGRGSYRKLKNDKYIDKPEYVEAAKRLLQSVFDEEESIYLIRYFLIHTDLESPTQASRISQILPAFLSRGFWNTELFLSLPYAVGYSALEFLYSSDQALSESQQTGLETLHIAPPELFQNSYPGGLLESVQRLLAKILSDPPPNSVNREKTLRNAPLSSITAERYYNPTQGFLMIISRQGPELSAEQITALLAVLDNHLDAEFQALAKMFLHDAATAWYQYCFSKKHLDIKKGILKGIVTQNHSLTDAMKKVLELILKQEESEEIKGLVREIFASPPHMKNLLELKYGPYR